ncbi:hypothetical protein [Terriglobus aquaticus]|uniref:hypothetical protein n=1 Tax=Terriglobus aquaticus TaxID=940139 RepID=UPI0021DF467A|nr:hypothetical protein [Terriglobus aquaticus]
MREVQEHLTTSSFDSDPSLTSILSLLRFMANRMATDPGRLLRPLTDVARHLCGADAAGICMERDGELVPADCLPVVVASGTCEALSGVDVPRAQSACAVAIADDRPKLFQVPNSWLPAGSGGESFAHGITAPWSAGKLRGTLWILNHSDAGIIGVSKYRTLLVLATLVGSAFLNLSEQESWHHEVFVSTSQALLDTLLEQVQLPLYEVQQHLEAGIRACRSGGSEHLRQASAELQAVSHRIDSLLAMQARPIQ